MQFKNKNKCNMYKYLIFTFIFVSATVFAGVSDSLNHDSDVFVKEKYTVNMLAFVQVDSLTYQYYINGKWDELIKTGKLAIKQKIDYKRLRQRLGYACFMKADYYEAMKHYEAALGFDKSDIDIRIYLYYCGLYTGNESYARYHVSQLPEEIRKSFAAKQFKLIDAVDLEYNYKSNDSRTRTSDKQTRTNPSYWRIGCSTKIGYQLSLYQAFSNYSQRLDSTGTEYNFFKRSVINQNEYYVSLNWKPDIQFDFMLGYHYINTKISDSMSYKIPLIDVNRKDTFIQTGNMFFGKVAFRYNRFDIGLSASLLNYSKVLTQQYTLQAAVTLPGTLGIKLKSTVDVMLDNEARRLIFSESAGFIPLKKVWIEGNLTLGNLNNFADYNGLYLLNSKDPTIFKTGASIFWQVLNKVSIFGNYGYDIKELKGANNTNTNYNQHSFSGGIIWKI